MPTAGPPAKSHSIYLREAALRTAPRGTKPHCEAPASLGIPSPKPSSEGHRKPADWATSGAQALAALPPCWPLRRKEADGRIGELMESHSTTCKYGLVPHLSLAATVEVCPPSPPCHSRLLSFIFPRQWYSRVKLSDSHLLCRRVL